MSLPRDFYVRLCYDYKHANKVEALLRKFGYEFPIKKDPALARRHLPYKQVVCPFAVYGRKTYIRATRDGHGQCDLSYGERSPIVEHSLESVSRLTLKQLEQHDKIVNSPTSI